MFALIAPRPQESFQVLNSTLTKTLVEMSDAMVANFCAALKTWQYFPCLDRTFTAGNCIIVHTYTHLLNDQK